MASWLSSGEKLCRLEHEDKRLFALVLVALVKSVPTDPGNVMFSSAGENWEPSTGVISFKQVWECLATN